MNVLVGSEGILFIFIRRQSALFHANDVWAINLGILTIWMYVIYQCRYFIPHTFCHVALMCLSASTYVLEKHWKVSEKQRRKQSEILLLPRGYRLFCYTPKWPWCWLLFLVYIFFLQAALCRCSQPLSGFSARCVEDENLLVCIQKVNPNTAQLVVLDTRPKINAMANRAAGKGYESEANYENTRFHFAGIDNIHVMRSSLSRLLESKPIFWVFSLNKQHPGNSSFLSHPSIFSGWIHVCNHT